MKPTSTWILGVMLSLCLGCSWASDLYNNLKQHYEDYLNRYKSTTTTQSYSVVDVLPTNSFPLTVDIGMSLTAVIGYDAADGKIQLIGSVSMEWYDDSSTIATTTPTKLPPITTDTLFVTQDQIWTPGVVLVNDAGSVKNIGDSSFKVRYNMSSQRCSWNPRLIIYADCSPDMTYFPFDKQNCHLTVRPTLHTVDKLQLNPQSGTWDLAGLEESSTWRIISTSLSVNIVNSRSELSMGISIKRKPLFFSMFIVLPTLLLSLLSGLVFLLPSGSGERVGFGVTCFLSFVVLLQIIMSMLPQVSAPMSLLCYYVIFMLLFSAALNVVNIFLMRLHLNPTDGKVPRFLVYFFELLLCKICKRCKKGNPKVGSDSEIVEKTNSGPDARTIVGDSVVKVRFRANPNAVKYGTQSNGGPQINGYVQNADVDEEASATKNIDDDTDDFQTDIDWPAVGKIFDWFFLLIFCGIQSFFTMIMIIPLANQYSE